MSDDSQQSKDGHEWNAYIVAPVLLSGGVGVIFGALFAMGKPNYAALIIAGVGACISIAGLALGFSLRGGDDTEQPDESA